MSVSTLPAAAIAAPGPAALATASRHRADAERNHGERLAVASTAVAVALMPMAIPRGPQNLAPADLFIGIAVTACFAWAVASRWRCRFPFALAMCVFMAAGAIAAFVGPVPLGGVVAILQDFELLVWCWALVNIASSPQRLRTLLAAWSYSSIVWSALLLVGLVTTTHFLTGQTDTEGSRTSLTFFDPNYSANYYVISIMVIWASRTPRRRGLRVLAYTMLVVALVSTGSNSGMLSLLLGTGIAATLGVYRRRGEAAALAVACFSLVGGFLLVSNLSLQTIQEQAHGSPYPVIRDGLGRSGASVAERSKVLHESIKLFWREGPLGEGPTSTKVRLQRSMAPYVKEAHDDYFAAVMERGVIGGIGLMVLIGGLIVYASPLVTGRLKPGFREVLVHPNAVIGALAGTLVAQAVYELLHVRHVWVLYAIVAAVYLWGRE
jgi:O-Antigen ligase